MKNWLREIDTSVTVVSTGKEALHHLCRTTFAIAVLDTHLSDQSGLDVFREALRQGSSTPIAFLSDNPPVETVVQAMKMGAQDFILKPVIKGIFQNKLAPRINGKPSSSAHLANRIDTYLAIHCNQSSLCVNDICAHFDISQSYVSKLFQKHFNTSFRNRLAHHRIQKAKHLLVMTDAQIHIISKQCGFKHQSRLTEAFRKIERITPRQYRQFNNSQHRNLPIF